jgi:hypothetical protein
MTGNMDMHQRRSASKPSASTSRKKREDDVINPLPSTPTGSIMHLQRTIGNRAVEQLLSTTLLKRTRRIGSPHNDDEREADRIAEPSINILDSKYSPPNGALLSVQQRTGLSSYSVEQTRRSIQRQGTADNEVLEVPGSVPERENTRALSPTMQKSHRLVNKPGRIGGRQMKLSSNINIFKDASDKSPVVGTAPYNTRIWLEKKNAHGWAYVHAPTVGGGISGWIDASCAAYDPPEPDAFLHPVQSGERLKDIAARYYKGKSGFSWGNDARLFVEAIYYANDLAGRTGSRGGIYRVAYSIPWYEKMWMSKSTIRNQLIWNSTRVKAGHHIWIPNVDFVLQLKASGKISQSGGSISYGLWLGVKKAAKYVWNWIKYGVGFIVGLIHGALECIYDLFAGVVDLVKIVGKIIKSLFQGEIVSDAKKLWNAIKNIDIKQMASDFIKKWNHPDYWERGRFRGRIVGYVIVEILMMIFSVGVLTAVKWSGRFAKVGSLLSKLSKVKTIASKLGKSSKLSKLPGKAKHLLRSRYGKALGKSTRIFKSLKAARLWAETAFKLSYDILKDLSLDAINRLKKIPEWARNKIAPFSKAQKKALFGCTSPCRVNVRAIWRRMEKVVPFRHVMVRGFRKTGEIVERFGYLRNRLFRAKVFDAKVGMRGSAVTGVSSKGGGFRWLNTAESRASDVDFFFTSGKLEKKLKSKGALFKPDGRLPPEQLQLHAPDVAKALTEFGEQTSKQLGRKANVILLKESLVKSLDKMEHILY